MCPSVDVRLTLKFKHSGDSTLLVFDVLDDASRWRPVIAESLPSSSALSRVLSLCALAHVVATEELAESSTGAT